MAKINKELLVETRQKMGLYSIEEIAAMFCCGRSKIDLAIKKNKLTFISPNNKTRYVYLKDFLNCFENKKEDSSTTTNPIAIFPQNLKNDNGNNNQSDDQNNCQSDDKNNNQSVF